MLASTNREDILDQVNKYKCLTFKTIQLYNLYSKLRSSYAFRLCHVNYNLKSYGSRAFAVSAPELWNKLPVDIRSCDNLNLFKRKLKTHLFSNYFKQM